MITQNLVQIVQLRKNQGGMVNVMPANSSGNLGEALPIVHRLLHLGVCNGCCLAVVDFAGVDAQWTIERTKSHQRGD